MEENWNDFVEIYILRVCLCMQVPGISIEHSFLVESISSLYTWIHFDIKIQQKIVSFRYRRFNSYHIACVSFSFSFTPRFSISTGIRMIHNKNELNSIQLPAHICIGCFAHYTSHSFLKVKCAQQYKCQW